MYKNLIFDLDGTIIDTLPSITKSVNYTLKKSKKPYQYNVKEVYNFVGYGTPYLIGNAFKCMDIKKLPYDKILKIYLPIQLKIHLQYAKLFPKLKETLTKLKKKGYRLYVVTNKPIEVAPGTINKLYGDKFFKDVSCPYKDTPKKPDPYLLNKLIKKHKLQRKECIYIGDGLADLLTAKNGKIDSVLVKYGYGQYGKFDENMAKYIINKPEELLKIFK